MLLAIGGLRLLVATNAGNIPRVAEVNIDWQVLGFTLAVSLLTGIAFGLAPIFHLKVGSLADSSRMSAEEIPPRERMRFDRYWWQANWHWRWFC
jgi:hypothetical protein